MINIKTLEVAGLMSALKGMRNPMNSWHLSDTVNEGNNIVIGDNDLSLAQRLLKSGTEHCKFMRQIHVWCDIDMPRYIWSEFDTYHFNTKNSCSTMHRLLHKTTSITRDLFVYNEEDEDIMDIIIERLNKIRKEYINTTDGTRQNELIRRAKQLLPEGFLQLRTVDTNYAELRNMVMQRKNHRLKMEWQEVFCKWVTTLPYAKELIFFGIEDEYERIINL